VRVLAINGSPSTDQGITAFLFTHLLEGMQGVGADVEIVYPHSMTIEPCAGEVSCWWSDPGHCFIGDDMQSLYPKLLSAAIWVLGIPVYVGMPGEMQNLLNRLVPLLTGLPEVCGDRVYMRPRPGLALRQMVLVANCGGWEIGNFDRVVAVAQTLAATMRVPLTCILRPQTCVLSSFIADGKVQDIDDALAEAGRSLIRNAAVSPEILQVISRPLATRDEVIAWYERRLLSSGG
jgi:multimeric flavodoxin WrbA